MTTSCCPAYIQTVRRHIPEMLPHVSDTPTPMHYTAEMIKSGNPEILTVFIGPCVAKRKEALEDSCVDFVMTFEELHAILKAAHIDPKECKEAEIKKQASSEGRGFGSSGGVAKAVVSASGGKEIRTACINGTSRAEIARMRAYAKNGAPFDLIEVMTCPGGCSNGAGVYCRGKSAKERLDKFVAESEPLRQN